MVPARRFTRRSLLAAGLMLPLAGQSRKGAEFPAESRRYADPSTEFEVFRLTDPEHTSTLPAYYNRAITRNSGTLLFCSDRSGSPQAFRMDLKTAQMRQLTDAEGLDGSSVTLTPEDRKSVV